MSAFMVSKGHIDRLVAVALFGPREARYHYGGQRTDGDAIGAMLIAANLESIHARYPDTVSDPESTPGPVAQFWNEPYHFPTTTERITAAEALKAISCYEYQSCEFDGWLASEAALFCTELREEACGYIESERGWDDWDRKAEVA